MAEIDFITALHRSTQRDYLGRVTRRDKAADAEIAGQFGQAYWDGDRDTGYGGYYYDGRWRGVATAMMQHYKLPDDAAILDVGCGKGFLLYEFTQILPRARVAGIDISDYALAHAKEEVKPFLQRASADALPFADDEFDLVISINTLPNISVLAPADAEQMRQL
ncbi:MAG: class I SAM-dependent methyltransferase, partial [Gammaproteobacteria bacterium SHHR-1]